MKKYNSSSYWSESQKQWVPVATMPLPYARNVLHKCFRDDPDGFQESPLWHALMQRLRPGRAEIITLLRTRGEVAFLLFDGEWPSARKRFKRLEKELLVEITVARSANGEFLEATCEPIGGVVNIRRVG